MDVPEMIIWAFGWTSAFFTIWGMRQIWGAFQAVLEASTGITSGD